MDRFEIVVGTYEEYLLGFQCSSKVRNTPIFIHPNSRHPSHSPPGAEKVLCLTLSQCLGAGCGGQWTVCGVGRSG